MTTWTSAADRGLSDNHMQSTNTTVIKLSVSFLLSCHTLLLVSALSSACSLIVALPSQCWSLLQFCVAVCCSLTALYEHT